MRPIQRGETPCVFKEYQDASLFLIDRLGDYCSYCERYFPAGLSVEHILPKKKYPKFELDWNNFLIGCVNCNSVKSSKDFEFSQILLPDRDNTFLALIYDSFGRVKANPDLPPEIQEKARRLIDLTGINNLSSKRKSRIVMQRREAWKRAMDAHSRLQEIDKSKELEERERIENEASDKGFFSVWMTVFADDPDMRRRFIKKFKGTATDCFDADGAPIPRPGGKI